MSLLIQRRALLGGLAMTLSLRRHVLAATAIDVFLVAGQSNALGNAELADAQAHSPIPPVGTALQYYRGTISPAVDPVGGCRFGSAWPMFCKTYHELTGKVVCVVPTAKGGATQSRLPAHRNGTWDVSDPASLTPSAIAKLQAAMTALVDAGYIPTFKGILWCQGESDAAHIHAGAETIEEYMEAFRAMRMYMHAALGGHFFVFQTGTVSGDVAAAVPQYRAIRAAQEALVNEDSTYTYLVFRDAVNFPRARDPALIQAPNSLHYTQSGYNRMGFTGAVNIVRLGL